MRDSSQTRLLSAGLLAGFFAVGVAPGQGAVPIGDLPPDESAQITLDATVHNDGPPIPFRTTFAVNRKPVYGTSSLPLLTDGDPDDGTSAMNPTEPPLDLLVLGNVIWKLESSFSIAGAAAPDDDDGIDAFNLSGGFWSAAITLATETDTESETPADGDGPEGELTLNFGPTEEVDIEMVSKTESIDPVIAGSGAGNLVYVITAGNNGPDDATGVQISEALTLPAGVTIDSIVPSAGTYLPANDPNGTWSLDLVNGATATLTVTMTAGSAAAVGTDTISDTAMVAAVDQIDTDSGNDSISEATSVAREVDIRVEKNGDPDPNVVAGSGTTLNLTYFVRAFNDGPSDASNVVVQDDLTLPANVTFVGSSTTAGTFDSGTGVWTVGDIPSGAFEQLIIQLKAESSAADGDIIMNTGSLTSVDEPDTAAGNDSQTVNTTVVREVDIAVTKSESIDPVIAGSAAGNLTYVVTATNNGPSDASGITISEVVTLPAGVTVDSITASAGSYAPPNGANGVWTPGDLASGASETLTVVLTAASSAATGTNTISDVATLTAVNETETNGANDSGAEATSVLRQVDIQISKTESIDPVVAGSGVGNLTHVVTALNAGPSDASGLDITEIITVPVGVSVDSVTPSVGSFAGTTWTIGDLTASSSATLTVVYTVDASALTGVDVVSDTASVSALNEADSDGGNDQVTEATSIARVVNLTLTKTESADPALAGTGAGNLVYVVTVMNDGPSDITGLNINEDVIIPAGVTIDSIVVSAGVYAPPNDANGVWSLDLVSGANAALTATLTVAETAASGTDVISDTATVAGSAGGETLGGDSSVTESTSILSDKDYGDAPDPVEATAGQYPTLLANDGPRHLLVPGDVFLGAAVDFEADGQPTLAADGDDLAGVDDEDGVTFAGSVTAGGTTDFDVVASAAGLLSVWVDFEVDGDWTGTGEEVFTDEPLLAGVNTLSFTSPVTAFDSDLADLLGGTFVRFRFSTGGGLAPTGFAVGGEVEDHFVTIATDADLVVTLDQQADPIVAGDIQIYDLSVTNFGPSGATDVTLQQELPKGGVFLGAEPSAFSCAVLSGVLVNCDLGNLAVSDTVSLTIGVLIDHRIDGPVSSEAVVAANEPDPDSSNDQADVDTNVAPAREMLTTKRGSNNALAIGVKEGDSTVGLVITRLGGGEREYSVEAVGFRATSMTEVPDFDATPSPEVAVLAAGFGGETKVVVVDADDQTLLGDYDVVGAWFAMDIVSVDSFDDTTAAELAILLRDPLNSEVRVQVLDAMTGNVVRDHLVATSTPDPPNEDIAAPFPIGMVRVDSFGGSPTAELAILMKNPDTEEVNVLVVDADTGAQLGNHAQGTDLFPLGIVAVGDLGLGGGTTAPDVAALMRRASDDDLFALVIDTSSGATFGPVDFDDTLLPGPFDSVPSFGGSTAPELVVTGREDPNDLTASVKDAATGAVVNSISISSPPLVPVPLDLTSVPDTQAGPAPELAILFEYFDEPAQVQVFDGAGVAPLFTFFLP